MGAKLKGIPSPLGFFRAAFIGKLRISILELKTRNYATSDGAVYFYLLPPVRIYVNTADPL